MDSARRTDKKIHPHAEVINPDVNSVYPPDVVDRARPDLLIAGPSCMPYSLTGGNNLAAIDQRRTSTTRLSGISVKGYSEGETA